MALPLETVVDVFAADVLHLMLMPTEACNFRCTYCYEDFRHGRMKSDVVEGVEALLSRRIPDLRLLDLSWFGGEPLAAADTVLRILRHAERERRAYPGLRFRSDMTTNGWFLDRARFEELVALGVTRFQVTLDGPPEDHDAKRVTAGGRGSFDRIWGHLLALRESRAAFQVVLRLHVDRSNADALPGFLGRIRSELGGDPRFSLFPRLLSRWGSPNDADLRVYGEIDGVGALAELKHRAGQLGIPVHEDAPEPAVCYAARGNSFLVRSDGRINKCTLALDAPVNQVGHLTRDGRLAIDAERLEPWMRGVWSGSGEELRCPMDGLRTERVHGAAGKA